MMSSYSPSRSASSRTAVARWQSLSVSVLLPLGFLFTFLFLLNSQPAFALGGAAEAAVETHTATEAVASQTGTIFYVTTTGSGSACTIASPCALQAAANLAQNADEVRVAAGTYTDTVSQILSLQRNTTFRGGFTTTNWDEPDPIANPTILNGQGARRVILIISGNPIIEGFIIENGLGTAPGGGGVLVSGGNPILRFNEIRNNTANPNENGAVYVSSNATIAFNRLHNNTGSGAGSLGGAIFVSGQALIEGNTIYQNTAAFGGAIFVASSSTVNLYSNVIYQNSATSTSGSGGIGSQSTGTLNIFHNTVANNSAPNATGAGGGGGIALFTGDVLVRNNIIANNTAATGSTGLHNAGATVTGAFNNLFNNTTNVALTNTIVNDPLFVNPGAGDYHLQAASLNINAADPASTVVRDFDQQPRPFNGGFDVGADEYYPAGLNCFARLNSGGVDGDVYGDIQTVIDLTSPGDVVKIAGTCTGTGSAIATLNSTITLRGGYDLLDWSEANRGQHAPTILDGQGARRLVHLTADNPTIDSLHLTGGTAANGSAIFIQAGNPTIQNSIVYENNTSAGGAIGVETGANPTIQFTTIADNTGDGANFSTVGSVHNSIVYNNSGTQISGGMGHSFNLVSINPLFVDAANDDYRLTAASPALDFGDPAATLAHDIEGDTRPHGQRPDVGADEANSYPAAHFIPPSISQEVDRGTVQNYNLTFESNGTLSGTWTLATSQAQGWDISHPALSGVINAGQSLPFGVVVTVPLAATPANPETILFTATSTINPNAMATAALNLSIRPIREILFTPSYSSTLLPAEVITYTHTITNNGEFTDTIRVRIQSDTFGWGQLLRPDLTPAPGNSYTVTLPAGGVSLAYVRVTVANFAPAGLVNNTIVRAESVADPTVIFATVTDRVTAKATVGTRYVSTIGNDLNNNCRVAGLPCRTVGHAVGQASVGDEVRVGAGTYSTAEIPVNATIAIRGGWNGAFTTQLEAPTIISAGGADRIFNISGAAITPYLELMTLREGNRTTGGAILVRNGAQPTLNQLTFLENQATRGGALYISAGTNVTLAKSAFRDNAALVDGGAIFVEGTLNSTNVLLEANQAVNGAAYYQRGTSSAVFWHNTIHGNIATGTGGGLYLESGSLSIQNSTLTSNQAAVTSGAIHRIAGTLTADYNNVWSNTAPASNWPMGTNSVSVDPLYIDSFYRLSPVSPILDIGNPASPLDEDFEGNARPSDQGFDLGWYELAGCLARRDGVTYFSLQEAINVGGSPLIRVSGVCRGVNTLDLGGGNIISQTAQIGESVHIQGGWNSTFNNNTTTNPFPTFINPQGLGRGLYIYNGASPIIESIAIINGDATGLGGGPASEDAGGGVYIANGTPFFSQLGVYTSTAELGGGVYNHLGFPTFGITGTHDTVLLNTADTRVNDLAHNSATRGGGLYSHSGQVILGNTFIRWNEAVDGAGAYLASGTGGTAANTVFAQNEASGNGGGLYNASNAALLHLTFYINSATGNGGGLYNTGNAIVRSHIFQSNTATSGPAIFNTGGTPSTGYNYYHGHTAPAVVGTAVGTGSITSATPPGLIAPALGNFRLSGTAAAIDKADPASPILLDFEQDLRPSNQGFDMGADELAGCYARLNGVIYGSPQAALANAIAGEQIDVAGNCIGVQPRDAGAPLGVISQTLYIDKNVTFLGGWRVDFSQRDRVTTLDAQGAGRVIYVAPGITATVRSFDIRGGNATVAGGNAHGGGIFINQSSPVFETNHIFGNTATHGGAIYVANGSPTIAAGNHITTNVATNGGAIYLNGGTAAVYNNFIYQNVATNQGGGLHSAAGNNLLVHNTVLSNTAASGGGVYIAAGSPTVQSSIYQSNQATTGSGAFGQTGSTPVMGYNTFFNNTAAGTATGGVGDRTADPNLSPEFTIDEDSSALNGGNPASPIMVDFEGDPRPSNQYADMGADEVGNCFARIVGQPEIYYSAQVAVNAAVAGDTVEVDGLCLGANQRTVSGNPAFQALIIDKELTIDGGSWDGSGDGVNATLDARGEGRGLLVTAGISATVQNIRLIGGHAAVAGFNSGLGGGAYNAGTLTLSGVYVTESQAADGAGIYQAGTGSLLLERSTIEGNTASNRGGGVFLNGATAAVQNNFLFDNTAANGGGALYNAAGNAAIWHNTVVSNTATNNNGGGFFLQAGAPVVGNNIVDSNSGTGIHATPAALNIRFNNVVGNTPANYGGAAADQQGGISLAPLYINPAAFDFHLQDLSAGVDVGNPNSPIANDFDGQQRPINTGFDIGADEIGSCAVRVVGSGPFPTQDFGVLQDAIDYAEANNLTEILIARGECAGTMERNGTFQVGYVTEDLNFTGSLARPNFTTTGDYATYLAPSTRLNALEGGRAIYIAPGASPTFTDIAFVRGSVAGQGGAIYNNGNTEIFNTAICQSTAQDGGGIYNALGATLRIEGDAQEVGACSVKNTIEDDNGTILVDTFIAYDGNVANQHGGGIYNDGTIVNIAGVGLYENTAVQHGGGIYNSREMLAQNVIFGLNEVGGNGGGVYNSGTTQNTSLINAVYFRNEATGNGGGLYHSASTLLPLHHNTFNQNRANEGGGLYNAHFDLTLNSTIFYSNTAVGGAALGGGVWSASSGTLAFNNFFGNTPTQANIGLGSNVVLDDPLLVGSYTLNVQSPAIDAADPSLVTLGNPSYEQDVRTLPRPDGGTANQDGNITPYVSDIGAYEHIKLFGCDVVAPFEERTIQAGQTTTYTLLLSNVGQEGPNGLTGYFDRIRVTLASSSQGWATLTGGPVQEFDLDWLATQPLQLVVTAPPTATTNLVETSVIACQSLSNLAATDTGQRVTRIAPTPGVIVIPDHELIIAQPGQVITYGHTVINTGNNNDTFELIANPGPNYANAILVEEDGTVLVDNIVDLTAGQAISTWLRVTILNDAPAGGLATPGVVVRSVADPAITDAAQNQIQIDFTTGNRYVAQGDTSDEHNNCTVLSNPCATVQHAVNQASAEDSILVSVGTYTDFYTRTVGMDVFTETLHINKSVTITGGYNSADEFATFQPLTNTVVLSGQDQHRVVYVAEGISVTLNGFFLANGFDPVQGAGLFNDGADLTLNGMLVVDNQAKFGAGIYHEAGALRLTSNVIARNISIHNDNGDGGGLYIEDGTAVLENNTFAENEANYTDSLLPPPTPGNGYGGGFYQAEGTLTLLNNIFAENGGFDQPDTTSTSAYFVDLGATTVVTQGYSLYHNNAGNLSLQASDLMTDPLFLDVFYHLSDFSPAVDSGTLSGTLGLADADVDGEPRLMGIGIDRGADELLQVPDFVFEPPLQTALIEEGEVYTYTYTLTNTGDLVDSYTINRTSNTTGGTGWDYDFYPSSIDDLSVGDAVTVTLIITGGQPGYVDTTNLTAVSAIDPTLTRVVTAVTTINQIAGVLITPDRSGSGEPGETITYSHTLTNTGNGPDTFSLTVASQLPAGWVVVIDPATTGVITPTGSIPVTVSVTVPVDGWAGVVHTAVIEAASVFSPTVTDSVTDTTTILPIYGLLIDPSAATYSSPEGAVAVYTHTLTNTGNVTDTVGIEAANGNGLTWTVEALNTPVVLSPFGSAVISVSVDVPLGSTGLTHVMLVTATSTLSPSVQATAVNTTTVETLSGVILQPNRSGNAGAGQTAVYTHTLTNDGNVSDSFGLTSNSSQGWTVTVQPTTTAVLAAGQTIPVTVTVSVPGGTAVGTIDVSVITATSTNNPAVTDTVTDTTTVVDVPERGVIIAPDNSRNTLAGQTIFHYHTITNTGTASDSYALTYDSSEGWNVTLNPTVVNLAAGQSEQVEVTLVVPGGVPVNTVDTLVITATSGFDAAVFDTATNTTTVTDTIVAELSLVPNNVGSGAPGTLVTYLHTLTNLGNGVDTITLQANSTILNWVASAVPVQVTLNPGQQAAVTVTVSIPASATNGQVETTLTRADSTVDVNVLATAEDVTTVVGDPGGSFNGAYLPLIMRAPAAPPPPTPTFTPTPTATPTATATPVTHTPVCIQPTYGSPAGVDLVVTAVEAFPTNPVTGQQVLIRVTIRNQGSVSVSTGNNFYLDAYFNRLPAFALTGDLAWGIQGADLAAGATRSYEAIYTFGAPGQYWMYGQVDTDNTVAEVNEANNQLGGCAAHLVTVTGPALNPDGGTPTSVPNAGQPRQTPTPNVLATPTAEPTPLPTETAVPTETATATPMPFPAPSETPTPDGSDGSEEEGKATATPEPTVTPSPTVLGKPEE